MSEANPRRKFAAYFARIGWIHALLLLSVWLFLFPFFWMLAASMKTDEEAAVGATLPAILHFQPISPYARDVGDAIKPADVSRARWDDMLPKLEAISREAFARTRENSGEGDSAEISLLVSRAAARVDRHVWTSDDSHLLAEFRGAISASLIADAKRDSQARLKLLTFQLRAADGRMLNLTQDEQFATSWKIESGEARLIADHDGTILSYHFASADSPPIVLRYDFDSPANVRKYILSLAADNSWHGVNISIETGGERWVSDETNYLAQFRAVGLTFQQRGFDDESGRAKVWTTLRRAGASSNSPNLATIRVTISPSSTLAANWAKATRNFRLAFKSVPFWKYFFNSIALVALTTIGSLFSASFVAYAFARLDWPGRSFAFIILLATMMLPGQVTMIPGFLIWRFLHWYNTLNPLWVPSFLGSAFFIFLLTQHMRTIPRELEEAARIDGLNAVQSWYYIILPNIKPSLAAITILSFIGSWNEFMGPLIYLRDESRFPISLGLYGLNLMHTADPVRYSSPMVMAGNVLMTLPVIVVFFLFQRYFVAGMTMTGMKS